MKTAHILTETPRFYLPEGEYKSLGFVSDLKESEVEPLVSEPIDKWGDDKFRYRNFKIDGLYDCRTALECFLSLLETKVMWVNPLPKPDDEELKWFKNQFYGDFSERYTSVFEWTEAQSRTFDKERTLVLVKER